MNEEIVLLLGRPCASCAAAEQVWRKVAAELDVPLELRYVELHDAPPPSITAVPTLLVGGRPLVVGVPEEAAARRLLAQALAD